MDVSLLGHRRQPIYAQAQRRNIPFFGKVDELAS